MEVIIEIIHNNAHLAPIIIFGVLLLAGLNVPVSEDAMILVSALLSIKNPELTPYLFLGVYAGAYFSDLICYWLGRILGPKIWQIKFFANMVSRDKIKIIHNYYDKYGIITLLVGRFIPFGVRNALFLTAGLGKMNFLKFALIDLTACSITVSLYFIYLNASDRLLLTYFKKIKYLFYCWP